MSVVDLNKDGIDDLAVSAPSFGAKKYIYSGKVYVYFGKKNEGLKENKADLEIYSEQDVLESDWQIEALGQYLSSGDVDGDGFDDLLIGCPYCGIYGKSRTVYIFSGYNKFFFNTMLIIIYIFIYIYSFFSSFVYCTLAACLLS